MIKNLKIFTVLLAAIMLSLYTGFAQTIKTVQPGDGTLSAAILSAKDGDVLQLAAGGIYTITSESTFGEIGFSLTIQVEPEANEKAILRLGEGASTSKKYYFFEINDKAALTLKGLEISGLLDGSAIASSMLIFDARPNPSEAHIGNFVFQDCTFHDFKDYIIHGMKDDYARGLIQDSVFIDNVVVYNAKHFLQYKHVSLYHLEMTNSTIYDLTGMALKIGKIGYRCVLQNPNKPYIPITDETITPTGFIDHCTLNNLGDIHGHIQIDEAYHTLKISNCIISNQQEFNQPPVYLNEAVIDSAVIFSNTCIWNTEGFGGVNPSVYIFQDTIQINPQYKNAEEADFSLPANSPLITFDKNGEIIGDPHWKSYITGIKNLSEINRVSLNCYPNPFDKNLSIEFTLKDESLVAVKIIDVMGMEVTNLLTAKTIAGKHTLIWNSINISPGIYFCTIKSGDLTESKKIMLNQ